MFLGLEPMGIRMKGADESTELWQQIYKGIFLKSLKVLICAKIAESFLCKLIFKRSWKLFV